MSEPTTDAEPQPEPPPEPETPPKPEVPPEAVPEAPPVPPRPPRRALRAVGRWGAAVLLFGAVGSGAAYGLTQPERTDLPGLATANDGRWDYPELTLPALPSGSPKPFAVGNRGEIHHVDIRELLLPPPEGAEESKKLPGIEGGWVSTDDFLKVYGKEDRPGMQERLRDDAVRHIAARGWTTPDGTDTRIYLLRFNTAAGPDDLYSVKLGGGLAPRMPLTGAPNAVLDESWPEKAIVKNVFRYAFDEEKPRGEEHVRQAYLIAGDTLALIIQSRPGTAHEVPFQQTVILQSQLLG